MKLHHLAETTLEDRQLISISSALSQRILDMPSRRPRLLGSLAGLVGREVAHSLSHIKIKLFTHDQMQQLLASDPSTGYVDGKYEAMWDPTNATIGVVVDLIDRPNNLRIALTHELRHALDDVKSSNAASDSYAYNYNDGSEDTYLAEPAEVNARYAEAMHLMAGIIRRAYKEDKATARAVALSQLPEVFRRRDILRAIPQGVESPRYKRLLSRGAQFIELELSRLQRQ